MPEQGRASSSVKNNLLVNNTSRDHRVGGPLLLEGTPQPWIQTGSSPSSSSTARRPRGPGSTVKSFTQAFT